MNVDFLDDLKPIKCDQYKALDCLFKGVVATNKLIGLDKRPSKEALSSQTKLCIEEVRELVDAIDNEDKDNLVKELLDVLVVTSYWNNLKYGTPASVMISPDLHDLEDILLDIKSSAKVLVSDGSSTEDFGIIEEICVLSQDLFSMLSLQHMDCVNKILSSNNSKFPTKVELSNVLNKEYLGEVGGCEIALQIRLIEEQGRYGGVSCQEVVDDKGDTRLVFWSSTENGKPKVKYLKPVTTKECTDLK